MKPNFALSLSHDGISLLQRSAAGWRSVGEADPSSAIMDEELEVLRRTATALAPGGLRCTLVIPNDQIRYLSVSTPGQDAKARRDVARAALEGATPYAVEELAFDIHVEGDQTHVAAVARETLEEAEAFATAHRLHPVSFTAHPDSDHPFASEAFFGPTECAADLLSPGEEVERDSKALLLTPDQETQDLPPDILFKSSAVDQDSETEGDDPEAEPSFVSRRRVPTFRTISPKPLVFEGATDGSVPGFDDLDVPFEGTASSEVQTEAQTKIVPAPAPVVRKTQSETERFTIYGARTTSSLSSRLGFSTIAGIVAVVLLAGLAAFAMGASTTGVTALFARLSNPEPAAQFTAPEQPQTAITIVAEPIVNSTQEPKIELASLAPELTDEDAAVLDALREPDAETLDQLAPDSKEEQRAAYAVTGIWPVAPDVPSPSPLVDLEDMYVTSIDPIDPNFDAVALPELALQDHDLSFLALPAPAPAGTKFELDERGMVVATPGGSLNPDGIMIFAGPPPARQPSNLVKIENTGEDFSARLRLAGFRPKSRPSDLIETSERAAFSGLTRSELSEIRPRLRPQSEQENALASASLVPLDETNSRSLLAEPEGTSFDSATARAVIASLRPGARPKGFNQTVAKALEQAPKPKPTATAAVAPRVITPKIPSSASASREATVKNALNLRKVNLIGVYGKPSSRRALVRLSSGRYQKVEVGDSIDGGRISAIGDSELRYQKNGRAVVLKMPRG